MNGLISERVHAITIYMATSGECIVEKYWNKDEVNWVLIDPCTAHKKIPVSIELFVFSLKRHWPKHSAHFIHYFIHLPSAY